MENTKGVNGKGETVHCGNKELTEWLSGEMNEEMRTEKGMVWVPLVMKSID